MAPSNFNTPSYIKSTTTSLTLSWIPPLNNGGCSIIGYEIYMNNADGTAPSIRVDQANTQNLPNLNQYTITTGLTNLNSTYMIMIRALTAVGNINSGVLSFVLSGIPIQPSLSPTRNDLINTSKSSIIINVNPFTTSAETGGSPIVSYELQRDDGMGGAYVSLYGSSVFSLSTNYIDNNIILGNTYRYIYRARNVNGWGPFSNPSYIKAIVSPNQPKKPSINSFSTTSVSIQINPLITYNGSTTITYELWMNSGTLNSSFSNLANYNGNTLTYLITTSDGLSPGNIYSLKVRAKNEAGMYSAFR